MGVCLASSWNTREASMAKEERVRRAAPPPSQTHLYPRLFYLQSFYKTKQLRFKVPAPQGFFPQRVGTYLKRRIVHNTPSITFER